MTDEDDMVDWTHEREWRVPGGFEFELDEVTVVLPSKFGFDRFIRNCESHKQETDIIREIRGMVNLGSVLY